MEDYTNISAFLIGTSTTLFAAFAIYFLFIRKHKTRFQTGLGWILVIWSLSNLKDIILTFPGMYTSEVLNWMMIIDGWGALTYTVFVFEAVMPGWTTTSRLSLQALPFAVFTLLYIIYPAQEVIYCYSVFLWFYAWTIVVIGWVKARGWRPFSFLPLSVSSRGFSPHSPEQLRPTLFIISQPLCYGWWCYTIAGISIQY